jgi:hypothetical protein
LGNIRDQRIIWVRVRQQGTDGKKNFGDCQCRRPLVLENVKTDTSVRVDVAMVDTSREMNLGWLERVVCWEMNIQEEDTSCIWRVIWSHDGCLPMEHIITDWAGGAICWWVLAQVDKL